MRTTEMTYVHYDLFTSLALYSTKLDALWQLGKDLFGVRGWRVKAILGGGSCFRQHTLPFFQV